MSFLSDFDAIAHEAFAAADMQAFTGTYQASSGGAAVSARVFVDDGTQTLGEFGQATTPATRVTILRADVANPVPGGIVVADGVTYTLDALVERDAGSTVWMVTQ